MGGGEVDGKVECGNLGNPDLSDSNLVQILVSELTCCVTSGKSPPISGPWFLQLTWGWQVPVRGVRSFSHLNLREFTTLIRKKRDTF